MATTAIPQKRAGSRKNIFLLLSAVVLLYCAGCAAPTDFDRVSSKLDRGGELFAVAPVPLDSKVFLPAKNRNQQSDPQVQRISALFDLIVEIVGIRNIKLAGISSVKVPDSVPPRVHNKFFALLDRQAPGLLNELFPPENQSLPDFNTLFPAETHGAFCVNIRFKALVNAMEKGGSELKQLLLMLPLETTPEIMESISGWYYAGFYNTPAGFFEDPAFIMVSMPDSQKVLHKLFSAVVADTKIVLSHENSRTTLYINSAARDFFTGALRRGSVVDELWTAMDHKLPETGIMRYRTRKTRLQLSEDIAFDFMDGSGVLRREQDGLLLVENSGEAIASRLSNLVNKFYNLLPFNQVVVKKPVAAAPVKVNITVEQQLKICRQEHLSDIFAGLKKYAGENGNIFPRTSGLAGWQQLLDGKYLMLPALFCPATAKKRAGNDVKLSWKNCSYVYFAGFKPTSAENRVPVVMDLPGNHKESFNVLYSDGSSRTVNLVRADSCRRMVSYLYTLDKYEEKIFRELMRQAARIDQEMKME